ncbi:amidohydrolase family protein [Sphingomonas koreensis]
MIRPLVFILACVAASAAPAQDLVLRGATVVSPDRSTPLTDAVVVVRGGRIVEVGRAGKVRVPDGIRVIDAKGKWIVPGYVDAHVHFFQSGGLYTRPDAVDLRAAVPYEKEIAAIQSRVDNVFARYLASGVTAVADVGGPMWNFTVRERAAASAKAPHVAVAGPLISTWRPPVLSDAADPPIIAAATAEEARALVRAQIPRGPDFVKIWYVVRRGETPGQFLPIVRAVIEEAHAAKIRVAVHATGLETARAAVQAGADILVHGVEDREVDAAFLALLRKRGVIYTTTLDVYSGYRRTFTRQPGFTEREYTLADPHVMGSLGDLRDLSEAIVPERIRKMAGTPLPAAPLDMQLRNLRAVRDAGVPIAMGTDAGNIGTLPGPSIYREFALMARAGLSPREVLASATVNGARLMGRADEIGLIARGRHADMVLLDADPLADVANLSRISMVIRGGRAWRQSELVAATPADVVQRQLNAYNARDLDAFIATYHPDVRLYDFPDTLRRQGHDALRQVYGRLFAQLPDLHAQVPRRIAMGNYVIDEEIVTGLPDGRVLNATAIYEVRDGLISRVWFIDSGVRAEGQAAGSQHPKPH